MLCSTKFDFRPGYHRLGTSYGHIMPRCPEHSDHRPLYLSPAILLRVRSSPSHVDNVVLALGTLATNKSQPCLAQAHDVTSITRRMSYAVQCFLMFFSVILPIRVVVPR